MHAAQLVANDAVYYYLARSGRNTDWPMWWVFDSADGPAPTAQEVVAHFTTRAAVFEPLRRRIHEAPGGFAHPFWVADDSPVEDHLVAHPAGMTWAACQHAMAELLIEQLDARECAWRLHIFPDVSGIDTLTGAGTVVLMHTSHALMAGPAMTSLSEALFAATPAPVHIDGQPAAAQRVRAWPAAVAGALSTPWRLARFIGAVGRENRNIARDGGEGWLTQRPRTKTALNRRVGRGRAMRTVPLDVSAVRVPGVTVTAVGLTAISLAMQRYFGKHDAPCPDDLAAYVTIAVPEATVMGVNRVGADVIDLHPGESGLADRARAVDATLRARRGSASSPRELIRLGLVDGLPSRSYRARFGTLPAADPNAPDPAHTILTSIRCELSAELSLPGSRFRFAGMLPPVYPDIALAHSFVGADKAFAVSVACDPDIVPDLDTYCDLLVDAFGELAAALA
ncbi:WSD1 family O-acyltransferase [Nocardia sp. NEAU-G5]|uniref:WSD1 family O-acyltransferase n=1 Tax=Nocardia albiluteola TaxID=2842303 RepID=A0ABS6B5D2_9NOCA|nr:wax ester/triacylglycerol synthase domain-containing protein [Nocardia albiluteola]MBU3064409.1 WSD1 family O-acyltransferase [Nocardia albiluteola]